MNYALIIESTNDKRIFKFIIQRRLQPIKPSTKEEKYENKKAQPEPAPQVIPQPITQLIEPKDGAAAILRVVGTAAGNV